MQSSQPTGFNISFFDIKKAKQNFSSDPKHVVGYARLSFDEDGENFVSIENQMSILDEFYRQHYQNETSDYRFISDDNISGYKFEREGLYKITKLIEEGKCNIIIAKDLSRIGRHGALTQLFIEQCERVGVRIHAMSDYDSKKESDDLILGIRAWSNERVVKDTSAKIKKIVKHKQKNGTWFCSVPFGYRAIDYQKAKIEVVDEAADIIRRIYDMYIHGAGIQTITRTLTEEHVPTPNMFRREIALANGDDFKKRISSKWLAPCISEILSNEFYVGTLVTGRYQRDGINGKDIRIDKEDWNKFENHHESIIDKETFDAVQRIKRERIKCNYRPRNNREHLFHGIVYCGDCGAVEYAFAPKNYVPRYVCSAYYKYGQDVCSRHSVKETLLIDVAINFLKLARESCREAIDTLNNELSPKQTVKTTEESVTRMKKKLAEFDVKMRVIEEQRVKQIIAHPEREGSINNIYDEMISSTQKDQSELAEKIEQIERSMASKTDTIKKANTAIGIIDQVIESGTITRQAVTAIFERITVYEDGRIDVKLKPYLEVLDPQHYTKTIKPAKHPEESYTISTDNTAGSTEKFIKDVRSGDPLHTTFIKTVTTISSLDLFAKRIVRPDSKRT